MKKPKTGAGKFPKHMPIGPAVTDGVCCANCLTITPIHPGHPKPKRCAGCGKSFEGIFNYEKG